MDWTQVVALIVGNLAIILPLWLWNRSESRSDNRQLMSLMNSTQEEMKQFHGRMCALEEKYIQVMQRYWENK